MKKINVLVFTLVLIFLVSPFITFGETEKIYSSDKIIALISTGNTFEKCADIKSDSSDDNRFCEEMERLGYKVKVVNENAVKNKNSEWEEIADSSDLIFIGDVEPELMETDWGYSDFCNNLNDKISEGINVFSFEPSNAWEVDDKKIMQGCIHDFSEIKIDGTGSDKNDCKGSTFRMNKINYITSNYEGKDDELVKLYKRDGQVRIHTTIDDSLITLECEPGEDGTHGFYSVLSMGELTRDHKKTEGVFWGFGSTSLYEDELWELFDRTILYMMGDYELNIDEIFTIPENPSLDEEFWLFVKTSDSVTKFKYGGEEGDLEYNEDNEYYESKNNIFTESGNIEIVDDHELKEGTESLVLDGTGEMKVDIKTENYYIDKDTSVRVNVDSDDADVSYRLRMPDDYEIMEDGEGYLDFDGEDYVGSFRIEEDLGELILEVNVEDGKDNGGSLKILNISSSLSVDGDFEVYPEKWILITREPDRFENTIKIKSISSDITNVIIKKTNDLFSFNKLPSSKDMVKVDLIEVGDEKSFILKFDATDVEEGDYDYTGDIKIVSDQFDYEIPIIYSYNNKAGDWLSVDSEYEYFELMKDMELEKSFNLKNIALFPIGDIKVRFSGDISNFVTVNEVPEYIMGDETEEITIKLDATGLGSETFNGEVIVESTHGSANVITEIKIVENFVDDFDVLKNRLEDLKKLINDQSSAIVGVLKSDADSLITTIDNDVTSGKYDDAVKGMEDLEIKLDELEEEIGAIPITTYIIIFIILIIIGVLAYLGFKNKDKIIKEITKLIDKFFPKKKGSGYSRGEYRTDYY